MQIAVISTLVAFLLASSLGKANGKSCSNTMKDGGVDGSVTSDWVSKVVADQRRRTSAEQKRLDKKIKNDGLAEVATDSEIAAWHDRPFTKEVPFAGKIEDQDNAGICWIYAGLTDIVNSLIADGVVPKNFKLSKNFFYFYFSLEKANRYFEDVIYFKPKSLDNDIFLNQLKLVDNTNYIQDGGRFSDIMAIVQKYGVVPEDVMPDTDATTDTDQVLETLREIVAETTAELVKEIAKFGVDENNLSQLQLIKETGEKKIIALLGHTLGFPPDEAHPFKVQTDKDEKGKPTYEDFDPLKYSQNFLKIDPNKFLNISTTPLQPINKMYSVKFSPNKTADDRIDFSFSQRLMNLSSYRVSQLIKKSIDADRAVYVLVDISRYTDMDRGIMDTRIRDVGKVIGVQVDDLNRHDAVRLGLAQTAHAAVIVGYETNELGEVIRFKLKNSYGTKTGQKGYFSMSLDWFQRYLLEAVIDRSIVTPHELAVWASDALEIDSFEHYYGP